MITQATPGFRFTRIDLAKNIPEALAKRSRMTDMAWYEPSSYWVRADKKHLQSRQLLKSTTVGGLLSVIQPVQIDGKSRYVVIAMQSAAKATRTNFGLIVEIPEVNIGLTVAQFLSGLDGKQAA